MSFDKVIRLKMLCFLIFGISATTIIEHHKLMQQPEFVNSLMNNIDYHLETSGPGMNRNATFNLTETLVVTLMRTSLLYVYLVMTLYYIILMETEDMLSQVMTTVGKFMIFLTILIYVIAEYFLPAREMYFVITRLAVILFFISSLQIIHLILCMWNMYFTWARIKTTSIYVYDKITILFMAGYPRIPNDPEIDA